MHKTGASVLKQIQAHLSHKGALLLAKWSETSLNKTFFPHQHVSLSISTTQHSFWSSFRNYQCGIFCDPAPINSGFASAGTIAKLCWEEIRTNLRCLQNDFKSCCVFRVTLQTTLRKQVISFSLLRPSLSCTTCQPNSREEAAAEKPQGNFPEETHPSDIDLHLDRHSAGSFSMFLTKYQGTNKVGEGDDKIRQGILTHCIPITTKDILTQPTCPRTSALVLWGEAVLTFLWVLRISDLYWVTEGLNPTLLSETSWCKDILTIPF